MKKSFIFGAALMCACAFGLQSCDQVDNPGAPTTTIIENGAELADVINEFAQDGVLTLPAGVNVVVSAPLELDEPITITSDEGNHAKVTFKSEDAGFVIGCGLKLENIDFDCSASNAAFIAMSKNPKVAPTAPINGWYTGNAYQIEDPIAVINCNIDNVNSYFLNDAKIGDDGFWLPKTILVDNCLVHLTTSANSSNAYFNLTNSGGFAENMTVKNSTFYNTTKFSFKYFARYATGFTMDHVKEALGWESTTLTYENCTFYNVCPNGEWGNYNGIKGKATSFWVMKNSIFWNCSSSGVARRFLAGSGNQSTATFENNTYINVDAEGTISYQDPGNYDKSGTDIQEDPKFADPANADFHISGSKQVELRTGDPRWL